MAVEANELIALIKSNPAVQQAILEIAHKVLPRGAVVGTEYNNALQGYRAVDAPAYHWQKEG